MKLNYTKNLSITNKKEVVAIDKCRKSKTLEKSLTSHAHSDHFLKTNSLMSSFETKEIIEKTFNKELDIEPFTKKKEIIEDVFVTPLNAGHILGSNMFLFENCCGSILYTGDFKTSNSLLFKGAKATSADTLIIESTFGKDKYIFPNRDQVYLDFSEKISRDLKENKLILIGGYSLGKSQELIKFVNVYLKEVPAVTKKIFDNSKIYENFNLSLGKYDLIDSKNTNNIFIVPNTLITKELIHTLEKQTKKKVKAYVASGWNHYKIAESIPISDHCDYVDLIDFVANVKPKRVFTMHGFSKDLARSITKELGIFSAPIEEINKKNIFEY